MEGETPLTPSEPPSQQPAEGDAVSSLQGSGDFPQECDGKPEESATADGEEAGGRRDEPMNSGPQSFPSPSDAALASIAAFWPSMSRLVAAAPEANWLLLALRSTEVPDMNPGECPYGCKAKIASRVLCAHDSVNILARLAACCRRSDATLACLRTMLTVVATAISEVDRNCRTCGNGVAFVTAALEAILASKELDIHLIPVLFNTCDSILTMCVGSQLPGPIVWQYRLRFAAKCMRAPVLETKLFGTRSLIDVCRNAILKHTQPQFSSAPSWLSFQYVWDVLSVKCAGFLDDLFNGRLHIQVVRRLQPLMDVLVGAHAFTIEHLRQLWACNHPDNHETDNAVYCDRIADVLRASDAQLTQRSREDVIRQSVRSLLFVAPTGAQEPEATASSAEPAGSQNEAGDTVDDGDNSPMIVVEPAPAYPPDFTSEVASLLEQRFLGKLVSFPDTLPPSISHFLTVITEQSSIVAHQRTLLSCFAGLLDGTPDVPPEVIARNAETCDATAVVYGCQPANKFRSNAAIFLTELIQRLLFARLSDAEVRLNCYEDLLTMALNRVVAGGGSATKYLHLLIGLLRGVETLPLLLPAVTAVNDRCSIVDVLTNDLIPDCALPPNTFPFPDRLCAIGKAALHVACTIDTLSLLWRVCHGAGGAVVAAKRDLFLHWVADLCLPGSGTPFEEEHEQFQVFISFVKPTLEPKHVHSLTVSACSDIRRIVLTLAEGLHTLTRTPTVRPGYKEPSHIIECTQELPGTKDVWDALLRAPEAVVPNLEYLTLYAFENASEPRTNDLAAAFLDHAFGFLCDADVIVEHKSRVLHVLLRESLYLAKTLGTQFHRSHHMLLHARPVKVVAHLRLHPALASQPANEEVEDHLLDLLPSETTLDCLSSENMMGVALLIARHFNLPVDFRDIEDGVKICEHLELWSESRHVQPSRHWSLLGDRETVASKAKNGVAHIDVWLPRLAFQASLNSDVSPDDEYFGLQERTTIPTLSIMSAVDIGVWELVAGKQCIAWSNPFEDRQAFHTSMIDDPDRLDALLRLAGSEHALVCLRGWNVLQSSPTSELTLSELGNPAGFSVKPWLQTPNNPSSTYKLQTALVYLLTPNVIDLWPTDVSLSHWTLEFVKHQLAAVLDALPSLTTTRRSSVPFDMSRNTALTCVRILLAVLNTGRYARHGSVVEAVTTALMNANLADVMTWLWSELAWHLTPMDARLAQVFGEDSDGLSSPVSRKRGRTDSVIEQNAIRSKLRDDVIAFETNLSNVMIPDGCDVILGLLPYIPSDSVGRCVSIAVIRPILSVLLPLSRPLNVPAAVDTVPDEDDQDVENRGKLTQCLLTLMTSSPAIADVLLATCVPLVLGLPPCAPQFAVPRSSAAFFSLFSRAISCSVVGFRSIDAVSTVQALQGCVSGAVAAVNWMINVCRVDDAPAPGCPSTTEHLPLTTAVLIEIPKYLSEFTIGSLAALNEITKVVGLSLEQRAMLTTLLHDLLFEDRYPLVTEVDGRSLAWDVIVRFAASDNSGQLLSTAVQTALCDVMQLPFCGGSPLDCEDVPKTLPDMMLSYSFVGPFGWSPSPRSEVGYVGLINQGMTCYQNSLLQQLFMIPALTEHVLTAAAPPKSVLEHRYADRLLNLRKELQRLFANLKLSASSAVDTRRFMLACEDSPSGFFPLDSAVHEQNDANEFFNILMDRLGDAFPDTSPPDVFTKTFGGQLVHELCGKSCPHSKQRTEAFMCVGLDVKGKGSVQDSLAAFVEAELLSGDNAYKCEECNAKVDTQKRCCFQELPQTLVLHLKRFEMNYDTFTKQKVNSRCEFPTELDMWQYTAPHLCSDENGPGPSDALPSSLTKDNCKFQLKGVLVHSGTANSGHYYSFIKERRDGVPESDLRWLQFNDETVCEFSEKQLAEECFGGSTTRNARARPNLRSRELSNNAFMLFYDRVPPVVVHAASDGEDDDVRDEGCPASKRARVSSNAAVASTTPMMFPFCRVKCRVPVDISAEIEAGRTQETLKRHLFGLDFVHLLTELTPIVARFAERKASAAVSNTASSVAASFVELLLHTLASVELRRCSLLETSPTSNTIQTLLRDVRMKASDCVVLAMAQRAVAVLCGDGNRYLWSWLVHHAETGGKAMAAIVTAVIQDLERLTVEVLDEFEPGPDPLSVILPPPTHLFQKSLPILESDPSPAYDTGWAGFGPALAGDVASPMPHTAFGFSASPHAFGLEIVGAPFAYPALKALDSLAANVCALAVSSLHNWVCFAEYWTLIGDACDYKLTLRCLLRYDMFRYAVHAYCSLPKSVTRVDVFNPFEEVFGPPPSMGARRMNPSSKPLFTAITSMVVHCQPPYVGDPIDDGETSPVLPLDWLRDLVSAPADPPGYEPLLLSFLVASDSRCLCNELVSHICSGANIHLATAVIRAVVRAYSVEFYLYHADAPVKTLRSLITAVLDSAKDADTKREHFINTFFGLETGFPLIVRRCLSLYTQYARRIHEHQFQCARLAMYMIVFTGKTDINVKRYLMDRHDDFMTLYDEYSEFFDDIHRRFSPWTAVSSSLNDRLNDMAADVFGLENETSTEDEPEFVLHEVPQQEAAGDAVSDTENRDDGLPSLARCDAGGEESSQEA